MVCEGAIAMCKATLLQTRKYHNDKPHKALFGMSPKSMEEVLFMHARSVLLIDQVLVPPLAIAVCSSMYTRGARALVQPWDLC